MDHEHSAAYQQLDVEDSDLCMPLWMTLAMDNPSYSSSVPDVLSGSWTLDCMHDIYSSCILWSMHAMGDLVLLCRCFWVDHERSTAHFSYESSVASYIARVRYWVPQAPGCAGSSCHWSSMSGCAGSLPSFHSPQTIRTACVSLILQCRSLQA